LSQARRFARPESREIQRPIGILSTLDVADVLAWGER